MDKRCATCRWWDTASPYDPGYGECQLTKWEDHTDGTTDQMAFATGTENYAILQTRPDFGCVQWEAKP